MKNLILIIIIIVVFFYMKKESDVRENDNNYLDLLKDLIPKFESFSPTPYWDNKQWSWGYGTAAGFDQFSKPYKVISKENAWKEAASHIDKDYNQLKDKLKIPLSKNQWAALLSFSYNLGAKNAEKLIDIINFNNYDAIAKSWLSYNKVKDKNGRYYERKDLTNRRNKELNLFTQI